MEITQDQFKFYNVMEQLDKLVELDRDTKVYITFAIQHAIECEDFQRQYGQRGVETLTKFSD